MVRLLLAGLMFFLASFPAQGAGNRIYGDVVVSRIRSVYDGDTFRCDIDAWPAVAGANIGVRVAGIDTPEIRDRRPRIRLLARAARDYVQIRLGNAHRVELRDIRRGKYFRIVADVHVDGVRLADELMERNLAKAYDGGTRPDW